MYYYFIKNFSKIAIPQISILKTRSPATSILCKIYDRNVDNKQSSKNIVKTINRADGIDRIIKNLSKIKIIRKSTKSKKFDFIKAKKPDSTNKALGIDFFISDTKKHLAADKKYLPKHKFFIILI